MTQHNLDFNLICRACAGPFNSEQTNLMEAPEILSIFLSFSATPVDPKDSLPKSICSKCNGQLEDCRKFQDMCIASYQFLLDCFPTKCDYTIKTEQAYFSTKERENLETHVDIEKHETSVEEYYKDEIIYDILDVDNVDDSDSNEKDIEYDPLISADLLVNKVFDEQKLQIVNEIEPKETADSEDDDDEPKETADSEDDEILADIVRKSKQIKEEERRKQVGNRRTRGRRVNGRKRKSALEINESDIKKLKRDYDDSKVAIGEGNAAEDYYETKPDKNYEGSKELEDNEGAKNKKPLYACNKCPKTFLKKEIYEGHMRQHEGLKPFECDKCNKKYSRFERLTNHKLNDHSEQPKRYCCEIAGCDRKYRNRETLQRHVRAHFTPPAPRLDKSERQVFICELCGKQLSTKGTLKEHEMMHKGESPYACDLCPKRFRVQHKLYLHKLRHEGVKNFKCEICGLKKTTNKELKSHMNIHTREKQFPCKVCGAIFLANGNLVRHVQVVHDGIKLYACSYCDKAFGKAETLRNHTMKHTGERPLKCPHCERRFISRTSLQYHVRRHEKDAAKAKPANNEVNDETTDQAVAS